MARRPRVLFAGAIYHITFRGNDKQNIFVDTRDRRRFLDRLEASSSLYQAKILLYCLMSNHVHLLVQTPKPNLDRFMGSLLTGYSVYFNRRHQRSGHLFQGRYKTQVVSGDRYLLNCSRYIHLNPVKTSYWDNQPIEAQSDFLLNYLWSSNRAYIGLSPSPPWLYTAPILALLPTKAGDQSTMAAYHQFLLDGLKHPDDEFRSCLASNPLAIGSDDFVTSIKNMYGTQASHRTKKEDAVLRKERLLLAPEDVIRACHQLDQFQPANLNQHRLGHDERCLVALALVKFSGLTQREVASMLKVTTGAAISAMTTKHRNNQPVVDWMKQLDLYFKG